MDSTSELPQPAQGPSADVVVLGGGLAGLYGAYLMSKAGLRVIVVEREFDPGGILRGHWFHGHRFSLAEAPLSTDDEELAVDLGRLLPPALVTAGTPPPVPHLRCQGVDVPLPCRLKDVLPSLPPAVRGNVLLSQLGAGIRGRSNPRAADAEEALRRRFGAPLCQLVLQPDLEQYWGIPLKDLAPEAASLPMRAIFGNEAIQKKEAPRLTVLGGPEVVASQLAQTIQASGGRLFYGAEVVEVSPPDDSKPSRVVIRDVLTPAGEPPSQIALEARGVLSTIPVRALVRTLGSSVPAQIHASSYYLNHLPVQWYACLIDKDQCLQHPTVHFRQRPFLRITEPRQFAAMPDRDLRRSTCLLIVEVLGRTQHSAETWQSILAVLESENICGPAEVLDTQWHHAQSGHPLLRRDSQPHLRKILHCVEQLPHFALAGACGRFVCVSPAEAMISARSAAVTLMRTLPGS